MLDLNSTAITDGYSLHTSYSAKRRRFTVSIRYPDGTWAHRPAFSDEEVDALYLRFSPGSTSIPQFSNRTVL